MKAFLIAAGLVVFIAGCAANQGQHAMLQGQPPAYQDGFRPGCSSGYAASGNPYYRPSKDVQRMLDDKLYAMGWNDGFAHCKGQYDSIQRSMR